VSAPFSPHEQSLRSSGFFFPSDVALMLLWLLLACGFAYLLKERTQMIERDEASAKSGRIVG